METEIRSVTKEGDLYTFVYPKATKDIDGKDVVLAQTSVRGREDIQADRDATASRIEQETENLKKLDAMLAEIDKIEG